MELCHEAGLYQIDLLNGSANRVTEREYWARKKGQAALDQENAALAAEGKPTKPTRFETGKEKLRQIIQKTVNESFTVEDFMRKLLQYGVTVKERRWRFSYLTPDRTKSITARKLGDSFDKAAVDAAGAEAREARSHCDAAAAKVTDKKALLEALDNYRNTYPVIKEYRAIRKDKQKFYAAHEADFIINDATKRQLDKLGAPKQLPKRKEVAQEIQSLISEKNECYNDYREKSDRLHELMTMQRNYQIAMPQPKRGRSHEQER